MPDEHQKSRRGTWTQREQIAKIRDKFVDDDPDSKTRFGACERLADSMRLGEFLTLFSIWMGLAGYFVGSLILAVSHGKKRADRIARVAWTFGCLSLAVHIFFAFTFYHHWSHTAALVETARQTRAVTSLDWGGGLYINYTILVLWLADVTWWWLKGVEMYLRRSGYLTFLWQGLLLFIIFNATVVFRDGAMRWTGILMSALLVVSWASNAINRSGDLRPNEEPHT